MSDAHYRWAIEYPDGTAHEFATLPPVTETQMMARFWDAVAWIPMPDNAEPVCSDRPRS